MRRIPNAACPVEQHLNSSPLHYANYAGPWPRGISLRLAVNNYLRKVMDIIAVKFLNAFTLREFCAEWSFLAPGWQRSCERRAAINPRYVPRLSCSDFRSCPGETNNHVRECCVSSAQP